MSDFTISKLKPIGTILNFGIIGFAIHKMLFFVFVPAIYIENFVYSILTIYFFFFFFSSILILVLDKIKGKNINYVGYSFLLLTTIKIGIAYAFLLPILSIQLPQTAIEKLNFFIIFIYFLAIETYLTIRILNNKQ